MEIVCRQIGVIHSPWQELKGMPIQPPGAAGVKGRVEVAAEYVEGLKDLDGFSHIILLYHFHRVTGIQLTVIPFMDTEPRGVFSTRAPKRPNPIGMSIVGLLRVEGNVLHVEDIDVLDGTPLLDVKPYVPEFDHRSNVRTGWLSRTTDGVATKRSDDRFR
ncbi:MAG: tRNA (N6-threonylcarbamoyladenosine(37)-N6)-methyltransferase TrmO [Lentisphaerae bacterium]|nr:tRNA (N6-threonylcarbamoyladenosine(37)-N6)-methyltransferase TrmO [Lentisphaerota bacterium]